MQPELQPAYLLHTRPYRESSLLAELLVVGQGRVGVVMRGARRGRSSPAQLFQPLLVSLGGLGELKSLKVCEAAGTLLMLAGPSLFSGFYLNELLVRLLPRDLALPEVFAAYALALGELAETQDVEPILRRFEKELLDNLGYGFDFDIDADNGEPVQAGVSYSFWPERGLSRCGASAAGFDGAVLLELASGRYDSPEARRAAKQILRQSLARQLGDKPLKSRELFQNFR